MILKKNIQKVHSDKDIPLVKEIDREYYNSNI